MIYFLEDDKNIRELVVYVLNNTGLVSVGFETPAQLWDALNKEPLPDLILLDIMLPEEDGLQVLKKLRKSSATKELPVIMLTAKGSELDKVVALDAGADDYIPKPFGTMELVARVKAVLRRINSNNKKESFSAGKLIVIPSRHEVIAEGRKIELTLKEFELLCLMIGNQGIVFTRDQILNNIWGYAFDGESRTVDVHIRTIRQKLGDAAKCIETVRGVGYRINEWEFPKITEE